MAAGKYNKRIKIQQRSASKDASGGNVETWADFITTGDNKIWAAIMNLSGNERRATSHGGTISEARTEFEIRYRSGVTPQMRVVYAGKNYNIKHVNDFNEEHRIMILTCDTGVNDG